MASRHPHETTGHQPPPTPPPRSPHPRSMRRVRSPPRTAAGAPYATPADDPANTSSLAQPDPPSAASYSSQLPSIECCCDDRLNPPGHGGVVIAFRCVLERPEPWFGQPGGGLLGVHEGGIMAGDAPDPPLSPARELCARGFVVSMCPVLLTSIPQFGLRKLPTSAHDGRRRGEAMSASGENRCPPVGRTQCPLTNVSANSPACATNRSGGWPRWRWRSRAGCRPRRAGLRS